MPLVFSTPSVGTLCVCSCWVPFLFGCFWIRVVFLFDIHSFKQPVCHGWMWIFKTNIHVYRHGLAFSNLVLFWVLLWMNQWVFSPSVFLQVLQTLFQWALSIRLFCYVLFVPIFCSKIVLFPCHPVGGICWNIHSRKVETNYYYYYPLQMGICILNHITMQIICII